jgi:hypothetical protein
LIAKCYPHCKVLVLFATSTKVSICWDDGPCSLLATDRSLRGEHGAKTQKTVIFIIHYCSVKWYFKLCFVYPPLAMPRLRTDFDEFRLIFLHRI